MIYSEMEYLKEAVFDILAMGEYRGHRYVVISYGYHPCAYVSMPKGRAILTSGIVCHGGITYVNKDLEGIPSDENTWWIGWDYAHHGDYSGLLWLMGGKKWTTKEIVEECERVIEQIEDDENVKE